MPKNVYPLREIFGKVEVRRMKAIYARQSVERPDSISIEMQIESCQKLLEPSEEPLVFFDRGFSGTNTNRPGFQKLLNVVKQKQVQAVLVYKLDRISRSLCDFSNMMALFREYDVTLQSVREQFDTHTEIGRMLLHMLMMFAEMEQKTIAGRVRDNYYARALKQMALGGTPPYGYSAAKVKVGGKQTTVWTPLPEEAAQVQEMYRAYGLEHGSIEKIVQQMNEQGSRTRTGQLWSNSTVARILHSPVYVQGNLDSARFLQQSGTILDHTLLEYCAGNGCHAYRSGEKGARKLHIAAGLHPGIVESALWIGVQERLLTRKIGKKNGSGHTSWLQGHVCCGLCGQRCYTRNNGAGAAYTYWVCRGKRLGICRGISGLRSRTVEEAVLPVLTEYAETVLPYAQKKQPERPDPAAVELAELEEKMRRIAAEMGEPSAAVPYLRQELESLHRKKCRLEQQLAMQNVPVCAEKTEQSWQRWWNGASMEQRRQAVEILLKEVRIFPDALEICLR